MDITSHANINRCRKKVTLFGVWCTAQIVVTKLHSTSDYNVTSSACFFFFKKNLLTILVAV